ncbi:hypothetical protein CHLNCDRAFT_139395 [Chlorella variabilis]|uniref:Uncharacterized protein n=1 Tax=Chlorella variabilis TaxID=554065 RepID=E1ZPP8_CHLVA|nr:hypothetical protein CHLNCDRAFT_139395 [Chlorella variabilis]EFN52184.1 hypothetical protein CHLNCDRAFT_139395 [Chlorella variabilis]|eukprot:XP_005844286.1 hypothetical protein CHLNCDRAFT_139395 [Chlorella variabilis]
MAAIPEHLLVQDALQAASGLNGRCVHVPPPTDYADARHVQASRVAELGWLLRKVEGLAVELASLQSVVHEALVAAARREVSNYYRLVAILEAQAQRQATSVPGDASALTLRRLEVWLSEPLGRLRVLAECLVAACGVRGGQLINVLYALSKHGDPLVRKVVSPVLEEACMPYFKQISAWVLNGTMDTTNREFLVTKEQLAPPHCDDPAANWRGGHRVNAAMQPNFMSDQLVADIFTTGKSIAFLREWCGDTHWAGAISGSAQQLAVAGGTYQQLRWLETAVSEVKGAVSSHLLGIVMQQHGLPRHLAAIKRFLLLGQGDFVRVLLDAAGDELNKSAKDVSQYILQAADILRRVDVRLPHGKTLEGDLGWDVFALQYHVDEGPLGAVLSPDTMAGYLRIFRLLWTIKHVEVVLEQCWSTINSMQRGLNTIKGQERVHGVAVDNAEQVPPLLRAFHAYRAEMASFVTSLQYYIVFEVLEPNWAKLMTALPKAADLDAVISLHENTLQAVATGMFLDGLPQMLTPLGLGGAGAADVQAGLRKTLRAVLDVQGPIQRLAATVEQARTEQALYLQRARDSEAAGEWNVESHTLDLRMFIARFEPQAGVAEASSGVPAGSE